MANNILLTPNASAGNELSSYQQSGVVEQENDTQLAETADTQPEEDSAAAGPIVIEDAPQGPPQDGEEKPLREWGLTFGSEEARQAYGTQLAAEFAEEFNRNERIKANINTRRAITEGFGTSKYDAHYTPGMDVEDARAKAQSWGSKIGLGLVKLGTTAGLTAANSVAGLAWGLVEGTGSLLKGNGVRGAFDDAVNNSVSKTLIGLQETCDEIFPHYTEKKERTEEYQREWYKPSTFFSGNFLGNNVLKNFGFTIGSIGSGALIGKGVNRIARAKFAKQISAAMAKATAGDAEVANDLRRIAEGVQRGTISTADTEALAKMFPEIAKKTRRLGPKTALEMAAFGAVGEGTSEGIMAANEYLQEQEGRLEAKFKTEYDAIEAQLLAEGNSKYVAEAAFEDEYGNVDDHKVLTQKGQEELLRRQQEAVTKHQLTKRKMYNEAERLSSTTMLLNLPILLGSNLVGWGKVLAGGESTSLRTRKSNIKGKITIGEKGKLTSEHKPRYNKFVKVISGAGKTALSEGTEEMLQGTVSSGAKTVADRRLKSFEDSDIAGFTNAGYDADTLDSVALWLEDMVYGGKNYLGDVKNWQEGAIGALTGLVGIPGRRWKGGIIGEIQEANDELGLQRASAAALDKLVNSDDFQRRWHDWVRGLKYRSEQEVALDKGDMYAWHNADDKVLINDIITFAEADSLDELRDFVKRFSELSDSDVLDIKALASESPDRIDPYLQQAPSEDIKQKVQERAKDLGKTIDTYFAIYDDLSTIAPQGTDKDFLNEMIFTSMQLKAFEQRYLTMLNEVLTDLDPLMQALAETDKKEVVDEDTGVVKFDTAARLQNYKGLIDQYFSGSLLPRDSAAFQKILEETEELLEKATALDTGMKAKVEDMKKLSEDRRKFFKKLITLKSEEGQQKHKESSITPQEVRQEVEQEELKNELESYKTVGDFIGEYMKRDYKGRLQFIDMLDRDENATDASKEANKMIKMYTYVRNNLLKRFTSIGFGTNVPFASAASDIWDMIVKQSQSAQDLHNLPDSVIPSIAAVSSVTTLSMFNEDIYKKALSVLRQIVVEINKRQDATGKLVEDIDFGTLVAIHNSLNPVNPISIISEEQGEEDARKQIEEEARKRSEERRKKLQEEQQRKIEENEEKFKETHIESDDNGYDPPAPIPTHVPTDEDAERIKAEVAEEQKKPKPSPQPKQESLDGTPTVDDLGMEASAVDNGSMTVMRDENDAATEAFDNDPQNISEDSPVFSEEVGECKTYYHTSVPEISATQMKRRRNGKPTDLSDFPKTQEGKPYEKIWNAIAKRGGFAYVSKKLKIGDKIYFVVDPDPEWSFNGEPQIQVCVKNSDGTFQVLNVLTRQGEEMRRRKRGEGSKIAYYGVDELRADILAQAKSFHSRNPKALFVYDKTSVVRSRLGGVIRPALDSQKHSINRPMTQIEGIDFNGPLHFVLSDSAGNVLPIKGSEMAAEGLKKIKRKAAKGFGLYFITHNISGKPVPLRVNIKHFDKTQVASKNELATGVRQALAEIYKLIKDAELGAADVESAREVIYMADAKAAANAYYVYTKRRDGEGQRLINEVGNPLEAYEYAGILEQADPEGKELLDFAKYVQCEMLNKEMHEKLSDVAQRIAITDYFFHISINKKTDNLMLTITKRKYGTDKVKTFAERLKEQQEKEKAEKDGTAAEETAEEPVEEASEDTEATETKTTKDEHLGESIMFPIADFKENDLVDYFAGENVPYFFGLNATSLKRAAEEGILGMSLASIYPSGVDFQYDPYIPSEGRFAPLSQTLVDHSEQNAPKRAEPESRATDVQRRAKDLSAKKAEDKRAEEEAKRKAKEEKAKAKTDAGSGTEAQPTVTEVTFAPAAPVASHPMAGPEPVVQTETSEKPIVPVAESVAEETVPPLVTAEGDPYAAVRNDKGGLLTYQEMMRGANLSKEQIYEIFKEDLAAQGVESFEAFDDIVCDPADNINEYLKCI